MKLTVTYSRDDDYGLTIMYKYEGRPDEVDMVQADCRSYFKGGSLITIDTENMSSQDLYKLP